MAASAEASTVVTAAAVGVTREATGATGASAAEQAAHAEVPVGLTVLGGRRGGTVPEEAMAQEEAMGTKGATVAKSAVGGGDEGVTEGWLVKGVATDKTTSPGT